MNITSKKKDNSTGGDKIALRKAVLAMAPPDPIVLETHGGYGRIYERTWFKARTGVVIEKDDAKCEHLAKQRPHWRVYQADCERVLRGGLGRDLRFDIVDLDPYGSPFDVLDALASSGREWPDEWFLVVNDGLRQTVDIGGAWHTKVLAPIVAQWGNNLHPRYLEVARVLVDQFAERVGFKVDRWKAYHTGFANKMTHYAARMVRVAPPGDG